MQSDNLNTFSRDNRRPLVIRSLRRSNIRKKIADYLFEICPNGSYTSEIAYNIKTTPTNVIGAIRGMGSRYKAEESLISLEVVEQIENNSNIKLYKITDYGKEIVESLKIK
jgi:predicted transcriptional regulator with HTH domain